jgi:hypothetical protein
MPSGLFVSHCPACGGELVTDHLGNSACGSCDRLYLNRFGHLIPIDPPRDDVTTLPIAQG